MSSNNCELCGRKLNKLEVKKKASMCHSCISKLRIEKIQTEEFLIENFNVFYLKEINIGVETIRKNSSKVLKIFQMAEKELLRPSDITVIWLESAIEKLSNSKGIKLSLFNFLLQKGLINLNVDNDFLSSMEKLLDPIPIGFKRLLEIYLNERMELQKRQVKFNARNPLALSTIRSDLGVFVRLVRWFQTTKIHLTSWDTVQQEDVHEFLLTLPPKNREIVRKDLLVLFKLGKRKRVITHIPILDIKSRELPPIIEPITFEEQIRVSKLIKSNIYEQPLECLLTLFLSRAINITDKWYKNKRY